MYQNFTGLCVPGLFKEIVKKRATNIFLLCMSKSYPILLTFKIGTSRVTLFLIELHSTLQPPSILAVFLSSHSHYHRNEIQQDVENQGRGEDLQWSVEYRAVRFFVGSTSGPMMFCLKGSESIGSLEVRLPWQVVCFPSLLDNELSFSKVKISIYIGGVWKCMYVCCNSDSSDKGPDSLHHHPGPGPLCRGRPWYQRALCSVSS